MSVDADDVPDGDVDPFAELAATRREELERKAKSDDADAWVAQLILDSYGREDDAS